MEANTPSKTARVVLGGLFLLSKDARFCPLLPKLYQTVFTTHPQAIREALGAIAILTNPILQPLAWFLERRFIPGLFLHFAFRKRSIEEVACKEVQSGTQQVIVIGAGLDLLGSTLLTGNPNLVVIEVDHPATQRGKERLLLEAALPSPVLQAADLSITPLVEALMANPSFNPALRTLFVAEGLTMYLNEAQVRTLLSSGTALGIRDHSWVFTCMTHRGPKGFCFANESLWTSRWLAFNQEPFRWGIRREEIPSLLESLHLKTGKIITSDNTALPGTPARGEDIVYVPGSS
jgi:methyltransferase (TIGR00027 family)